MRGAEPLGGGAPGPWAERARGPRLWGGDLVLQTPAQGGLARDTV